MTGFRRILVPVDFSAPSAAALRMATRLAGASGGTLDVVHVYPFRKGISNATTALVDFARDGGRASRGAVDRARATLELWRARAARTRVPVHRHFVLGRPGDRIPDLIGELGSDLVVMGTRGYGGVRGVMPGSVASEVVMHVPIPVLVTRGPSPALHRILVADDFSRGSGQALRAAAAFPHHAGMRVLLLHVIDLRALRYLGGLGFPVTPDPAALAGERRRLLERLKPRAKTLARAGLKITSRVLAGDPVRELCRAASAFGAGAIVVATHGAGGLRRFVLGTTTQGLLCSAPCPVLAVKPLDWKPSAR